MSALLAPASVLAAPANWVAAFDAAAARDPEFAGRFCWSPWARLAEPGAWRWFAAATGLPDDWAFEGATCHQWAAAGLYPGVCRVVPGPMGLIDADALTLAPDDWGGAGGLGAGRPIDGRAAIALPLLTRASLWDPARVEPLDVIYLFAGGAVARHFGLDQAGLDADACYVGRPPELALTLGASWRMYASPLGWLADALRLRDGYDADAPYLAPGGGAVLDLDRFIARYGEDLIVDCGSDARLAARYARRRKALLRPARPALPEIRTAAGRLAGAAGGTARRKAA